MCIDLPLHCYFGNAVFHIKGFQDCFPGRVLIYPLSGIAQLLYTLINKGQWCRSRLIAKEALFMHVSLIRLCM